MKMRASLRAQGVWGAVSPKKGEVVNDKVDQAALAMIYQAVPDSMMSQLVGKETAYETWEALRIMHEGVEHVKEVRLQALWSEYEIMQMMRINLWMILLENSLQLSMRYVPSVIS